MTVAPKDELQGKRNIDEAQTPWKHEIFCTCEDCISYFPAPAQSAEVKQ